MDYKETYEKFWEINKTEKFENYERNLLLPLFFQKTNNSEKVLDVAGGSGIITEWLGKQGYDTFLVEFSDLAVKQAKDKGIKNIVQLEITSGVKLPYADNFFDKIFFGDIIEHLFDSESVLKELRRVLRPGGAIVISCPNMAYWRFRTYYLFDGDFERIDVAKQKPWEQEHIRFFNSRILKEYLNKLGFRFIKLRGANNIWHSKLLARIYPNLFAHTIVTEFINNK